MTELFASPYEGIDPGDETLVAQSQVFELRTAANLGQATDPEILRAAEQKAREMILEANTLISSVFAESDN